jgi:streptogramin lyase
VTRSPLEPPPPQGFIYINSIPAGFQIFLNERNTGRVTPDSISYIDAGQYEITLRKKYFKDTSLVVNLIEDQKLNLNIDILSNPSMYGGLHLITVPEGANITLNDSALNKISPLTLQNLLPGEYTIKFDLFNHRDAEFIAIVQSSKTNIYQEELRDTSEWIDYQVSNSNIHSNFLSAITIDDNDIMWIGSLNEGLIKYDGVNFINFKTSNSQIPANKINCLSIDNQNRVWVGTDLGIGVFSSGTWILFNSSNSGLTSEIINTIRFDNNDVIWIGTAGNLVKFDGIGWTVYNEPNGKDWVTDIYSESENTKWLGARADGIFIFENESFTSLEQPLYGYPSNTPSSITSDNFANIWFSFQPDTAGRGGVSYWDGSGFNNFLLGTSDNSINHIFIDDENNKWIATTEGFILFDAQNNSTTFRTANSLISSDNIRASIRDRNGNVWITTIGGGLNKLKWNQP